MHHFYEVGPAGVADFFHVHQIHAPFT